MKWLDSFLDRITMYRLVLYYLIGLLGVAMVLGVMGVLKYSPLDIAFSAAYLTAICWVSNKIFAYAFDAPTNVESPYITALILALIISPTHDANGFLFLTAAAGLAIASKFMLSIHDRHIFNPAALAVVLTSYGAGDTASWWVGTASMLPFVLVGGLLMVRRIRRVQMVLWFAGAALATTAVYGLLGGGNPITLVQHNVVDSALFFAGFVMLTEPLTSPTTKGKRAIYSVLTGVLFPPQFNLFGLTTSPELALVIGNVYAYLVGPRAKTFLRLKQKVAISPNSMDFVFTPKRPFAYQAGQYMEFTFQHPHTDSRGSRRYLTLASSPTEQDIRLGIKFYDPGSSYKRELLQIDSNTPIIAGQLGGDFVLPKDPKQKLVFIAGGIGITPFRSMVKYLVDTKQQRDVTLIYSAKTADQLVYRDVFNQAAAQFGAKIYYLTGDQSPKPPVYRARIDATTLGKINPAKDALYYISGPHDMVVSTEKTLLASGVSRSHIKKDFFSGY